MLSANDIKGNKYYAWNAAKDVEYFCPYCDSPMILKQGRIKISHFAHKSVNKDCPVYIDGEGYKHDLMKKTIKEILDKSNDFELSQLEYKFKDINRVPDLFYIMKYNNIKYKLAVECIDKNRDINHFCEKIKDYASKNIYSIWFFNMDYFKKSGTIKVGEMRVLDLMLLYAKKNYGKIWAVDTDNKCVFAIHFNSVSRYNEYYDEDGNYCPSYYTLKKTKMPVYHLQYDTRIYFSRKCNNDLLVGPFCEPFWK